MRIQNLLAGLLSALLLAMSSWASACDLSCSLQQLHSSCQTQSAASSRERTAESASSNAGMGYDMAMPPEHSDHMTMAESDAKAAMVHLVATACTHRACDQGLSLASVRDGKDRTQLQSVQSVAVDTAHVPILSLGIRGIEPQEGPPPLGPVNPLFVSLRI